jgi:hypothetical protein
MTPAGGRLLVCQVRVGCWDSSQSQKKVVDCLFGGPLATATGGMC